MSIYRIITIATLTAVLLLSAVVSAQEVTLTIALREDQPTVDIYRELLDQFEEENPGIKVDIFNVSSTVFNENIMVQIAAGIPPDVLYVHYAFFPELARKKLLLDLTEFIDADGYALDDFFPPTIEQLSWDGVSGYALPRETSSAAIFYNLDMFDKAGVQHPTAGWTYDDMVEMARKLTLDLDGDGTKDQYGIYGLTPWFLRPNIYWSHGAEILNADGTKFALHEPAGVNAVQWIADLINVDGVVTTDWGSRFASGRSAMEMVNFWHILGNRANPFQWDAAMMPAGPEGSVIRTATGGHGILTGSKNPDAAWELVKFISSTESQLLLAQTGTIIPARRSAAVAPEFLDGVPANRRAFVDAMQYGRPDDVPLEVNTAMDNALAPVWTGAKPASVALEEARPVIDQILSELNE